MNDKNQNDELIEYICGSLFDLQGRLRANEIMLNSLMSVVCENAPELIEKISEKAKDTAELSIKINELTTEFAAQAFEKEINQSIRQFELIEEASKYSDTFIEVKRK